MANQAFPIPKDFILEAMEQIDLIIDDNKFMIENIDMILYRLSDSWDRDLVNQYSKEFNQYKHDVLPQFCLLMDTYRNLLRTMAEDTTQVNINLISGFDCI